MLSHRDKLGLSADQVRQLERLRSDYEKESIRKDADLRIAEMDLQTLLDSPAVDMGKVESKVREIEKLRADLRLARIRAVEKGKEQLTSEQRQKLQELLGEPGAARRQPRNEPER
jgi:Spy/CpxP family protein refolding chaperone